MLTISAMINTATPSGIDDNKTINPPTLMADLNTLTLKCGVSLLLILLILLFLMLVALAGFEPTTSRL